MAKKSGPPKKGMPTSKVNKWSLGPIAAEKKILTALRRSGLTDYQPRTREERLIFFDMVRRRPEVVRKAIAFKKNHPRATWVEAWTHSLRTNGNRYPGSRK